MVLEENCKLAVEQPDVLPSEHENPEGTEIFGKATVTDLEVPKLRVAELMSRADPPALLVKVKLVLASAVTAVPLGVRAMVLLSDVTLTAEFPGVELPPQAASSGGKRNTRAALDLFITSFLRLSVVQKFWAGAKVHIAGFEFAGPQARI